MPFFQLEQPFCSISKGLCTKVGIVGARCYKLQLACHPLGTGDGSTDKTGDLCGPASTASRELIHCGFKKGCTGCCSARKQH